MLLAEAGCVFMGFILFISWVEGRASSICALEGSSVDLPCSAEHPTSSMKWFTVRWNGSEYVQNELSADGNHVTYNMSEESNYTLTIKDLRESDAKFYCCSEIDTPNLCWHNRTELYVAVLRVELHPAVLAEGQRVTLTCITSCPPTDNTTFIWYLNKQPVNLPQKKSKQLVLDPVSSQHAGNYSCAVKSHQNFSSSEKTLTVESKCSLAAAARAVVALLVITALFVFLWIMRRTRISGECRSTEATVNMEQLNPGPVAENISAQPKLQDDLHYSRVHFSMTQTDPLYSTVQPRQPK